MKKVVVALINYKNYNDTIQCIDSIKNITYQNYDIIIIDNNSGNESVQILGSRYPEYQIISNDSNLGYTGGVNIAFKISEKMNADYCLILNPDTIVTPTFLNELVSAMNNNQNAAAAGGKIYFKKEKNKLWFAGGKIVHWRGLAVHYTSEDKLGTGVEDVDFLTGCMILYRIKHIKIIGPLDDRYFMYLDDIDYSCKIKKSGFDLLYVPRAIIYHDFLDEKINHYKLYYSVRNRLLLIKECFIFPYNIVAKYYFVSVIIVKLIYWRIFNKALFKYAIFGIRDYYYNQFGHKKEFK